MNNFLKKLIICSWILNDSLKKIVDIWENEINDEIFMSKDTYKNLVIAKNKIKNILHKRNISFKISDADKLIKEIYDYSKIINNKNKTNDTCYYDFAKEKSLLPDGLLDATITCSYIMNYIVNKLGLTIQRENINEDIEFIFSSIKEYMFFTENELILEKYKITNRGKI